MGLTLKGGKKAIAISYPGFFRLRKKLAELTDKDFGKEYGQLSDILQLPEDHKQLVMKHWNQTCNAAIELYRLQNKDKLSNEYFGFFFAADCDGELSVQGCKDIQHVIRTADKAAVRRFLMTDFGIRTNGSATGDDFLDVVRECVDSDTEMKWF